MLFNSSSFLIFMVIVFCLYWAIPHRFRWVLLLISSYYFYMSWDAKMIVLVVLATLVTYAGGLYIEKTQNSRRKKLALGVVCLYCFGILGIYKYFNFFAESLFDLLNVCGLSCSYKALALVLPVGISFYTFQVMSYVIDVYKKSIPAEKHLGIYALFIAFFPKLVTGPIERAGDLLGQLKSEKSFSYEDSVYGLKMMAWGMFKKVVIADMLAIYVDAVYGDVKAYMGGAFLLATFFYTIQIYCDFSGYSDIAIGAARMLGITLSKNFNSPYFSSSIKEFWGRWHITLSRWFRDYVYIPLGGNRVSFAKNCRNLIITFTVSGLWHGANWTFIIWGFLHGALQVVEKGWKKIHKSAEQSSGFWLFIKTICTFLVVCFAWAFFRADSIYDALWGFYHCLRGITDPIQYLKNLGGNIGFPIGYQYRIPISIAVLMIYDWYQYKSGKEPILEAGRLPAVVRWGMYYALLLMIAAWGVFGSNSFIYFQF